MGLDEPPGRAEKGLDVLTVHSARKDHPPVPGEGEEEERGIICGK